MQRADELAIDEFLIRNQRLLHDRVRRWRIALRDVEDCISDLLEDIAVGIVNGKIRPSRSVSSYVIKAFRTRVALHARTHDVRDRAEHGAAYEGVDREERVVAGTLSEETLRASHGVEWEPLHVPPAVARLASMLDESLTDEERRILSWLSNFVAQREISEWLGVTYAAGAQRIWRLRERLRSSARAHADRYSRDEQIELEHFFRDVRRPASARAAAPPAQNRRRGGGEGSGAPGSRGTGGTP